MRKFTRYTFPSVALAALLAGFAGEARPDDKAGIVTISDTLKPIPEPNPLPASLVRNRAAGFGVVVSGETVSGNGNAGCPHCNRGYPATYQSRSRWHHGRYHKAGEWDYIHGPSIHPIVRNPVEYQRYQPDVWYGDPRFGVPEGFPTAPMVYHPTDTTQLGYYHQRVPSWQPDPCRIPPYPVPSQYHRFDRSVSDPAQPACQRNGAGNGNGCRCGANCRCGNGFSCGCGCSPHSGWSLPTPAAPQQDATPTPADPGTPPAPNETAVFHR